MVFSSLVFISVFLPVVFILDRLAPSVHVKNGLLLAASLLFYAYGEPVYVFLMVGCALFNYAAAAWLDKAGSRRGVILGAAVTANLLMLGIFKYAAFLTETLNAVGRLHLPVPHIRLPIGISFFTFQAMSYVIDVYRRETKAQRSFTKVLLYISFFPQLIAGPIVKYHDVQEQIEKRHADAADVQLGLRRFAAGLSKKVLIANTLGETADILFALPVSGIGRMGAWAGAVSYFFQIYFDFSGYSDMAIGLGRIFGFRFQENFRYPYCSDSITDFWRRWHISLSSWFREYLYIPLGGNRKGKLRTIVNKWLVFLCTGLWHGASGTFLFWGIYHGFFLMLEEALPWLKKGGGKPALAIRHIYTLLVVMTGFVFFRAETLKGGFLWVKTMFLGGACSASSAAIVWTQLTPLFLVTVIAAAFASFPFAEKMKSLRFGEQTASLLSLAGLALSILSLAGGTYNPFIYFRF